MWIVQPGPNRTTPETLDEIRSQLWDACLGVQGAIETRQTVTGIKDKIAEHWIAILIKRSRELQQMRIYNQQTRDSRLSNKNLKGTEREQVKSQILTEIQSDLFQWLLQQPSHSYEKLTIDSRESFLSRQSLKVKISIQLSETPYARVTTTTDSWRSPALMFTGTHLWRYFTRTYLVKTSTSGMPHTHSGNRRRTPVTSAHLLFAWPPHHWTVSL